MDLRFMTNLSAVCKVPCELVFIALHRRWWDRVGGGWGIFYPGEFP